MIFLIHNIRKIILSGSVLLALGVYLYIHQITSSTTLADIRLTQIYALLAVTYLYFALLASPLFAAFPKLKFKPVYIRSRRALGQSVFLFACLHIYFAFFKQLGGFGGLFYLNDEYIKAIFLSFLAFVIISAMTATSFDFMVKKLGTKWKTLHRFVYVAAFFLLIHALMLGTHFSDLTTIIPKLFFVALAILLVLEALRLDKYLKTRFPWLPDLGFSIPVVVGIIVWSSFYLLPEQTTQSLGIHSQHIQLAQQAQNNTSASLPNLPGLRGDRTKRYSVSFDHPENVSAGENVKITFKIYDAASGSPVTLFERPYEKFFHLIVLDQSLNFFEHLHPEKTGNQFSLTTSFPKDATYHLYTEFQPVGAIDQQQAFTLTVGTPTAEAPSQKVDTDLTKTFGAYKVTLKTSETLSAAKMSLGQQTISFNIADSQTNQPITNLKPYLNSFGHLVMINQTTYDYLHVHPNNLTPPPPNANGGPQVDFLPIGIYGSFKEGIYRVFGQFNHDGKLFVADFTIKVGK